jgi:hypothetical protein
VHTSTSEGFCLMHTVLTALIIWFGVSVLVGAGFSLGAALGHRRGLEAARTAARDRIQPAADTSVWTDRRVLERAAPRTR